MQLASTDSRLTASERLLGSMPNALELAIYSRHVLPAAGTPEAQAPEMMEDDTAPSASGTCEPPFCCSNFEMLGALPESCVLMLHEIEQLACCRFAAENLPWQVVSGSACRNSTCMKRAAYFVILNLACWTKHHDSVQPIRIHCHSFAQSSHPCLYKLFLPLHHAR